MRTVDRTKSNQEAWKNVTLGIAAVLKFNQRGELEHEHVLGGRMVNLTPEERRINQEMCAEETLDMFSNGILMPVRLLEGEEDIDEIKGNPNHLSEEEMTKILKSNLKTFDSEVSKITNAFTMRRLFEMASAEDMDLSHRKVSAIEERLAALEGVVPVVEREVISGPKLPNT